jgi:ABC-type branched-subunit amino acid transport system substrate-binding protein
MYQLEFDSFHNKIKPFLVVGPFRSQLVQSLQTVFSVLDVPHIGPLATSIRLSDPSIGPTFFRPTPNDYETVIALTTLMKRFKLVHMAVVTSADDYGEGGPWSISIVSSPFLSKHIYLTVW